MTTYMMIPFWLKLDTGVSLSTFFSLHPTQMWGGPFLRVGLCARSASGTSSDPKAVAAVEVLEGVPALPHNFGPSRPCAGVTQSFPLPGGLRFW